jgi:UDP-N-acetylglucosamine--N-acetylmuramyl-(pentapeptide) pyrophosphoryl-undecaprenol N-acetylglucosamine transferase
MPKPTTRMNKIVIATGGTGGHVFPAEALGAQLLEESYDVTFVGGGLKNNRYFHRNNFKYEEVTVSAFFKVNVFRSCYRIIQGIKQSLKMLSAIKPKVVIGFGSFYTFPVLLAARLKKIPIVLFEPNAIPGKVNRLFSRWAAFSAVQFAEAGKWLTGTIIEVKMPTGKRDLIEKGCAREYFYLNPELFTFLVFGGSQGAESINRLFSEAACRLKGDTSFQVIHVTGKTGPAEKLRSMYAEAGIPACVKAFEERMDLAWSAASVVICRSGAATVAEQITYAVPGILVPFPQAADDHQTKNAQFIEKKVKGGITCPESTLTVDTLRVLLSQMLRSEQREKMHLAIMAFKQDQRKQELSAVIKGLTV